MATSLTLVDVALEPEMVYTILDALYESVEFSGVEAWDTITYLEDRLLDADLPIAREVYEEQIKSPDFNPGWREVSIFELTDNESVESLDDDNEYYNG
jgi:hypothetical protein